MAQAGFSKDAGGIFAQDAARQVFDYWEDASTIFEREQQVMADTWTRAGFSMRPYLIPAATDRRIGDVATDLGGELPNLEDGWIDFFHLDERLPGANDHRRRSSRRIDVLNRIRTGRGLSFVWLGSDNRCVARCRRAANNGSKGSSRGKR